MRKYEFEIESASEISAIVEKIQNKIDEKSWPLPLSILQAFLMKFGLFNDLKEMKAKSTDAKFEHQEAVVRELGQLLSFYQRRFVRYAELQSLSVERDGFEKRFKRYRRHTSEGTLQQWEKMMKEN